MLQYKKHGPDIGLNVQLGIGHYNVNLSTNDSFIDCLRTVPVKSRTEVDPLVILFEI